MAKGLIMENLLMNYKYYGLTEREVANSFTDAEMKMMASSGNNPVSNVCREVIALRSALQAANSRAIPEGWIAAINLMLNNDGSRGCFDMVENNAAHREIEQLLTDLKGHNEPFND